MVLRFSFPLPQRLPFARAEHTFSIWGTNTHGIASLYETFEPKEARRLAERLDIHYTPKHGSWLNMAEIELSVLKGQCLDRRIPDMTTMQTQVAAWERDRNNSVRKIVWQFTTSDARIKLKRLYPKL